jgi:uncharacterized membrane protein YcaP (DUF421 family)
VRVLAIAIIRTLILYLAIVVSMRVMGKRQLGELEPAEFVVAVLISDLAAHPLQDIGPPLMYGLIPVLTLLCCQVLISAAALKSVRLRAVISGKPSLVIENGKLLQREMKKNRYTVDELTEQLRKKDITDLATVKYAILETDGTLSAVLYASEQPATPRQMKLDVDDMEYPVIVVNDGRVLDKNLQKLGFNRAWLQNQLKSRKLKDPREVFLMSADAGGRVYFAAKELE